MNLKDIWSKIKIQVRKKAPQIMIYGGLTSMVGGTIAACVETRKAEKIFADHKERTKEKKSVKEYMKTGVKLAGVYWPSIVMTGVGITGVVGGERIQHGRYLGAVSIAAALKAGNDELRKRIADKYGEEEANQLYNGLADLTDKQTGQETADVIVDTPISPYARIFAYGETDCAEPNYDYNLMYLQMKENAYNTEFSGKREFMSANYIWEDLGYPRTKSGQTDGYVWDGKMRISLGIKTVRRIGLDGEVEEVLMIEPNFTPNALELAVKLGKVENK